MNHAAEHESNEQFLSKLRSAVKSEIQSRLRYEDVSEEKVRDRVKLRQLSSYRKPIRVTWRKRAGKTHWSNECAY